MKSFWSALLFISIVFLIGIVGGVEHGKPLSNLIWCIPCFAVMVCSAYCGKLYK